MSRRRRELKLLAEERWPLLTGMLTRYFDEDCERLHGSVGAAIAAAAADGSTDHRRTVVDEWWDWNGSQGATNEIRPFLEAGFGVAMAFGSQLEARKFMNRVHEELIVRVRAETRARETKGKLS